MTASGEDRQSVTLQDKPSPPPISIADKRPPRTHTCQLVEHRPVVERGLPI